MNNKQGGTIPVTLYADFVEDAGVADMDTFLTRVCSMPVASQNKLLQEKLLLINEKLANVFEEIVCVRKFHKKLGKFFQELKSKVVDAQML